MIKHYPSMPRRRRFLAIGKPSGVTPAMREIERLRAENERLITIARKLAESFERARQFYVAKVIRELFELGDGK